MGEYEYRGSISANVEFDYFPFPVEDPSMLTVLFCRENHFLLIDEPTNHLYIWDEPLNYIDVFSWIQIEELLENSQMTLLFVEHDQAFCEKIKTKEIFMQ